MSRDSHCPTLRSPSSALSLLATPSPRRAAPRTTTIAPPGARSFSWAGQIQPGQNVEISGVNGRIRAEPSSSGQVEVIAVKIGPPQRPARRPHRRRPARGRRDDLRGLPRRRRRAERVRAGPARTHEHAQQRRQRRVHGARAGRRHLHRPHRQRRHRRARSRRPRRLHTVNGDVEFSTQSNGSVKTVNGSITGKLGRADWQDTLELKTVNGSITLLLPGRHRRRRGRAHGERADPVDFPSRSSECGKRSSKARSVAAGAGWRSKQ